MAKYKTAFVDADSPVHKCCPLQRHEWLEDFNEGVKLIPVSGKKEEGKEYSYTFEPPRVIFNRWDKWYNSLKNNLDAEKIQLYIHKEGNIKLNKQGVITYKRKRNLESSTPRSPYMKDLKEYIFNFCPNVIMVTNEEVDDHVSCEYMRSCKEGDILCHIDKDLDMIPGVHYNFDNNTYYEIDEIEAFRNFCMQVLMGDASDGVPGLYRVGETKAKNILKDCKIKSDMFDLVLCQYNEMLSGLHPDVRRIILHDTCTMLWIKRSEYNNYYDYINSHLEDEIFKAVMNRHIYQPLISEIMNSQEEEYNGN